LTITPASWATGSLQQFFARESCGFCTPCRDGLPWIAEIYGDLEEGRGQPGDIELLEDLAYNILGKTFCTLALGAMFSVESGVKEFERSTGSSGWAECPCRLQRARGK
jgi:NADH-quinone oxidoreductase subunit F